MAYQAPSVDPRRTAYSPEAAVQERIRRLAEMRAAEQQQRDPFSRQPPVVDMSSARRDRTAEIVDEGAKESPAAPVSRVQSAEEVLAEEDMKKDGGPLPPARPKPFPVTPQESAASDHGGLRLTGPDGLAIPSELPESVARPINLGDGGWRPAPAPPASRAWRPLPGERGGAVVRKALGKLGAEAAAARAAAEQKAKDEAELAAEEQSMIEAGLITEDGMPTGKITGGSGTGTMVWEPAPKGTGYVGLKPGQERRIGATPEEMAVPLTGRRLPGLDGNRPPMLPDRGQSVERDGGMSPRAPQAGVLDMLEQQDDERAERKLPRLLVPKAPSERDFFAWREAMKQLAMAAGVNVARFENEEDLVKEGAKIAAQYERMNAPLKDRDGNAIEGTTKYERTITSTGAPVYTPSDAMRKQTDDAQRRADAREFVRNFGPEEAIGKEILQEAEAGNWARVRELKNDARASRTAATGQAARDMRNLRGQTQNMMNPRVAPAMRHNSIMGQPDARGVGKAKEAWGERGGGDMMVQAEAIASAERQAQEAGAREERIAATNAGAKKTEDPADYVARKQAEARAAVDADPDANWNTAVNNLDLANQNAGRPKNEALYVVAGHLAAKGRTDHPAVKQAMQTLYSEIYPGPVVNIGGATADMGREEWQTRRRQFIDRCKAMNIPEGMAEEFLAAAGA